MEADLDLLDHDQSHVHAHVHVPVHVRHLDRDHARRQIEVEC